MGYYTLLLSNILFFNRCASTHFGEIQLAPDSVGISPLTMSHPLFFQQQSVRTSAQCYLSFTLPMARSSGFGSANYDQRQLILWLAFTVATVALTRSTLGLLLLLTCHNLQVASSFFNRHEVELSSSTACKHTVLLYFTPLAGFFSPFPHGTFRYRLFRIS